MVIHIHIRLLQEYIVDTDTDISDLLLGAALIYNTDPDQGYRIIRSTLLKQARTDLKLRTIPSLNHISLVVNPTVISWNYSSQLLTHTLILS